VKYNDSGLGVQAENNKFLLQLTGMGFELEQTLHASSELVNQLAASS
jgi:hypothetical protein